MLDNLYSFSRNSWHVRLFKWIYGTNPTTTFNTMCPYFWSMVFTLLCFPLILPIRLLGKTGSRFLSYLESYKREKRRKLIDNFINRCSNPNLSDKEAYYIVESKCWKRFNYELDYDIKSNCISKWHKYHTQLLREKQHRKETQIKYVTVVKENKYFPYIAYLITFSVFIGIGYTLYKLISSIEFLPVDWELVLKLITTILIVGSILLSVFYIIIPCFQWIICKIPKPNNSLLKYIVSPFKFIWNGILIIRDMIYMTYKKACPRIDWRD
jgi:hypothetical protein